ncbi:MAG TPA: beta-ketoacyl synthase N-terminal-like domain-containing protein, partial [Candidatus Obscuribacterales bacterium]
MTLPGGREDKSAIAIIGMSCLFPGAPDLASFWTNIVSGTSSIREVAGEEWGSDAHLDLSDRIYCRRGGFITEYANFDPLPFGIMPNSIRGGDPEQFLALRVAHEAMKDAGYLDRPFDGDRAEVILGRTSAPAVGSLNLIQHSQTVSQILRIIRAQNPHYSADQLRQIESELRASLLPFNADTIPAVMPNILAGRIANRLGFRGRTLILDAACASSLIAVETGIESLLSRRCDLVLAGGIHVNSNICFYEMFCKLGAVSHSQEIRPFDQNADGTLLGEGLGMVVLKRLEDAVADGDRIYAVILGIGSSSDGRGSSVLAPSVEGEALALERAYEMAGVSPRTVGLLEAHGTGTTVGDAVEMQAVERVFGKVQPQSPSDRYSFCALGSVKSMIGHCQAASGVAGLIKAALALYHRVLPPTLNVKEPNRQIDWSTSPCYINVQTRPWVHPEFNEQRSHPRRAAVSAFGFGGVNCHAVLEEFGHGLTEPQVTLSKNWDSELCLLEAESPAGLLRRMDRLTTLLEREHSPALLDIAFSLSALATTGNDSGSAPAPYRLAIVASSVGDLKSKLIAARQHLSQSPNRAIEESASSQSGIYYTAAPALKTGKMAFVLPGLGAAYPNMLLDLCLHLPEVRAVFDFVDLMAQDAGEVLLPSRQLFPLPAGISNWPATSVASLALMDSAVVTVILAEWALFTLLRELDVHPDAVMGCSTGEFAALTMSGASDIVAAAKTFYKLSKAVAQAVPAERLSELRSLRAEAGWDVIHPIVSSLPDPVYLCAEMTDREAILSGTQRAIEQASLALRSASIEAHRLPAAIPYHTPLVSGVIDYRDPEVQNFQIATPAIPTWACSIASLYPADPEEIRLITTQFFEKPIQFRKTIEAMYADGVAIFVEVGPKGGLTPSISAVLLDRPHVALAANVANRSAITQINHLLASLACRGVPMTLSYLFERRRPNMLDLDSADPAAPAIRSGLKLSLAYPEIKPPDFRRFEAGSAQQPDAGCVSPDRAADAEADPVDDLAAGELSGTSAVVSSYLNTLGEFHRRLMDAQQQVMVSFLANEVDEDHTDQFVFNSIDQAILRSQEHGTSDVELLVARSIAGTILSDPDSSSSQTEQSGCRKVEPAAGHATSPPATPDTDPAGAAANLPFLRQAQVQICDTAATAGRMLTTSTDLYLLDHAIGGTVSSNCAAGEKVHLLPLMVALEIMTETASLLAPGMVPTALNDVWAYRRIRVDHAGFPLVVTARLLQPDQTRILVEMRRDSSGLGSAPADAGVEEAPLMTCEVTFAPEYPAAPEPELAPPAGSSAPRLRTESLYGARMMFHGPRMQCVRQLDEVADRSITGTVEVRGIGSWFTTEHEAQTRQKLLIDPNLLDNASQLVLFYLYEKELPADALLPFHIESLQFFGPPQLPGEAMTVHARLLSVTDAGTRAHVEIVGPDGQTYARITGISSRRIVLPHRWREFIERPAQVALCKPLSVHDAAMPDSDSWSCFRFDEEDLPQDEVTVDWLTDYVLSPEERDYWLKEMRAQKRKREWLMGRIAAKDAVRALIKRHKHIELAPADIIIVGTEGQRPAVQGHWIGAAGWSPLLSISHSNGVAVALA